MIRRAIRSSMTALAVAFFAVPQVSLAQAANDQAQVDPLMQKAARIQAMNAQMRVTHAQRVEAAKALKAEVERVKAAKAAARAKGIEVPELGIRGTRAVKAGHGSTQTHARGAVRSTSATALPTPEGTPPAGVGPLDIPDYNTTANWAFSPMLKKFVHSLPGLGSTGANDLGQYIPVAHPDTVTYPGSDYYEISLRLYTWQFGGEKYDGNLMPPTNVRGYVQTNNGTNPSTGVNDVPPDPIGWLGPVIVAQKDRPVRIKFKNELPSGEGGNLIVPVDESIMGSGKGASFPNGAVCDPTPPGVNLYGQNCALYPQTRAAIHLHGGRTPWISDGTPHQWILPIGDYDNGLNPYKHGVSLANVPDMPVPGPDETTYYWTNQQSARLMFYHDHAWGITRLNVLSGEAAGLVITDPTEQDLITEGILPGIGIPLVIQDRTFVDAARVRLTDPTWNSGSGPVDANGIRTPVDGDFWMPHVYVPAQNPYMAGGVNPFGRWVYGPWFFPPTANLFYPPVPNPYHDPNCSDPDPAVLAFCTTPGQPPVIPGTPTPSVGAETFFDTQTVNGAVFPYLDVEPKAYRFRILNASNDRFVNLNLYEADPLQVAHAAAAGVTPSNTEVEMCATPGPIPAATPVCWDSTLFPDWPNDGRVEGVPNPAKLGPDIVYIGTEGGFLPKPVVLTGQPITFVTDPTAFNVGNVDKFNLFVGPAERADVIIDFTGQAGKTFIFYNDSPAAVPAFDPRFGYTTGAEDLSANGGYGMAPPWSTTGELEGPQVGYGPNVRSVMQFRVGTAITHPELNTFNLANLQARWMPGTTPAGRSTVKGVFDSGQDQIIVGQADYDGVYIDNPTFPSVWPAWGLSRIEDNTLMFETVGGTIVTFPMEPKAMHDEMGASFDKEYARMSTNLGVQMPVPKTNNANMTPMMYQDPATEIMNAALEPMSATLGDGTQIWKISHNGVDMHPIHFHIFDVQVINRVGWDGQIRLPAPQELGWKDTVRISPLEDTIVAMRPWTPPLPFAIPYSLRALNPAIPIGSGFGFTNIDPLTQTPIVPPITNQITDFAWEYVWHCHILSHEENDMMRPIVLNVLSTIPPAPAAPVVTPIGTGGAYNLTWVDPTPVDYVAQTGFSGMQGLPGAKVNVNNLEIGFRIDRETSVPGNITTMFARANQTTFDDTTTASLGTYYRYRVVAFNEAGEAASPWTVVGTAPAAVRLTSVSITVANTAVAGITQNTWTKSLATTVSPIFRGTGAGGNPAAYEYMFEFRVGAAPNPFTVVQSWGQANTWTMPIDQVAGTYAVRVSARNGPNVVPRTATRNYTVAVPAPVATLALASVPATSPQLFGTAVAFTATPTGGAAAKQYQYSLSSDAGLTWTVVQAWNGTATGNLWTLPATTPVGDYLVKADVRTNATTIDATAQLPMKIQNPAASGVTLTSKPTGIPDSTGYITLAPPVSFLATGSCTVCGSLSTATGGGYYYQFSLDGVVVQPYGTNRVYTMPITTPNGNHTVRVDVTTSVPNADQVPPVFAEMKVNAQGSLPATAVTLSPTAPIQTTYPTGVTFTAAASGGAPGAVYSYRFALDGGTFSAWDIVPTYTTSTAALGGTHTVVVQATSMPAPIAATFVGEVTASTTYVVNYPAATGASFTSIVPASPQPIGTSVAFTAAGSSSIVLPASAYKYQFSRSTDGGTTWTDLQPWSASATYNMVGNVFEGFTTVKVDVTTENTPATVQASFTTSYGLYGPATAVNWVTVPAASWTYNTATHTFVAQGVGGGPAVPGYNYRFLVDGVEVQGWSSNASYVMPADFLGGVHVVRVEATTAVAPAPQSTGQVFNESTHTINYPPSTGVTVVVSPAGSAYFGTPVTFTATGSPNTLPASAFKYRFLVGGAVRQNWSTNNVYVMPATEPVGQKEILIESTTQLNPTTLQGADYQGTYTITQPPAANAVTLNVNLASPQIQGTTITWTAAASSSVALPPESFQYQFNVSTNGGPYVAVQPWNSSPTFNWNPTAGNYNVTVWARTGTTGTWQVWTGPRAYAVRAAYTPPTSVTLDSGTPAGATLANTQVTFIAGCSGSTDINGQPTPPSGYEYQFNVSLNGGAYAPVQTYSTNSTFNWTPAVAGSYNVTVWCRTDSGVTWDVWAGPRARTVN